MAIIIDTKTTWAITFHEVVFVFGPFLAMVPLLLPEILTLTNINLFWEKIKQIYIKKR
jgi:hypothetical protein